MLAQRRCRRSRRTEIHCQHSRPVVAGVEQRHFPRAVKADDGRLSDAPRSWRRSLHHAVRAHARPAPVKRIAHCETDLVVDTLRAIARLIARPPIHAKICHQIAVVSTIMPKSACYYRRVADMVRVPRNAGGIGGREDNCLARQFSGGRERGMPDVINDRVCVFVAAVKDMAHTAGVNHCRTIAVDAPPVVSGVDSKRNFHLCRRCGGKGGQCCNDAKFHRIVSARPAKGQRACRTGCGRSPRQ